MNDKNNIPEHPWYLLRGDDGNASISTTILLVSFAVVTLSFLISTFEKLGSVT